MCSSDLRGGSSGGRRSFGRPHVGGVSRPSRARTLRASDQGARVRVLEEAPNHISPEVEDSVERTPDQKDVRDRAERTERF